MRGPYWPKYNKVRLLWATMERVFILQLLYNKHLYLAPLQYQLQTICWSLQWQWSFEQVPWMLASAQTWSNLPVVPGADLWRWSSMGQISSKHVPRVCPCRCGPCSTGVRHCLWGSWLSKEWYLIWHWWVVSGMDPKHPHHSYGNDRSGPSLSKEAFFTLLKVLMILKGHMNI